MLPRSSADIPATAKRLPPKATRKKAKPGPPLPYSDQITSFSSTATTEPTPPISQLSQLQPVTHVGSSESHSIGGLLFRLTAVQNFLKDSPTEIDVNEGETCSYDEETTLEFLFSFLLRGIIFSLAFYLIWNLVGNHELIKFSSFYKQTISVRSTLS